jgi:5-hydroxyisourate hydrolase
VRLSVHVVDCAFGMPAANVSVSLRKQAEADWLELATARTGSDGSLSDWTRGPLHKGIYQIVIDLDAYYTEFGVVPLHPRAIVEFRVTDPTVDLFLPVLVTANSFQTYRDG